jgi:hypothetical protein
MGEWQKQVAPREPLVLLARGGARQSPRIIKKQLDKRGKIRYNKIRGCQILGIIREALYMTTRTIFSRLLRRNGSPPTTCTIIVSGLPRSGTSMTMRMLRAGGLEVLTDQIRVADEDNPKGYYEFERVKNLRNGDHIWVEGTQGKVVKVISALLEHLPPQYQYKVIFMRRNMHEILASQKEMMIRRGEPTDKVSDEHLAEVYAKHLMKIETWLSQQQNMKVLYVDYNDFLSEPEKHVDQIVQFLGQPLQVEQMAKVVDKNLYRQRI